MAKLTYTRAYPHFTIEHADGRTVLIQVDYDYPGVASRMGWPFKGADCDHSSTDGTVDCPDCGKSATDFITEAADWIADHAGEEFPDLDDYFSE